VSLLGIGLTSLLGALALRAKRVEPLIFVSNLITLPLIFLSSTLIPAYLTPDWVQTAMKFNPVNYAVLAVRPLFLTGYDLTAIGAGLVILGAWAAAGIIVAEYAFRRFGDGETATLLNDSGHTVAVLEADRIVKDVTVGTTAKISAAPNVVYDSLLSKFGKATAQKAARANVNAVEKIAEIVRERKIDCNFRRFPLYIYAESDEKAYKTKRECRAARGWDWRSITPKRFRCRSKQGPLSCARTRLSFTLGSTSSPLPKISLATAVMSLNKPAPSPSNPVRAKR